MVSTLEACRLLNVSRSTFLRLQSVWTPASPAPFPEPMRVTPRLFYWDEAELVAWRRRHRRWRYAGVFTGPASELLTAGQIVASLAIPPERLQTHRRRDGFPDPVDQVGRSPLWARKSIREWVLNTEVISKVDLLPKRRD